MRVKFVSFVRVIPRHISSPKWKLRSNTDVIDYFAGDNEIYE